MLMVYYNSSQEDDDSHGLTPQAWEQGDKDKKIGGGRHLVLSANKSEVTLKRV